jgi:hypothetical protein
MKLQSKEALTTVIALPLATLIMAGALSAANIDKITDFLARNNIISSEWQNCLPKIQIEGVYRACTYEFLLPNGNFYNKTTYEPIFSTKLGDQEAFYPHYEDSFFTSSTLNQLP